METSILYNYPIAAMLAAWFIAQASKLVSYGIRERRFDYGFMFRLGGMPSSHSASAASCTTAIGLVAGWSSPIFAIAVGMTFLIVVDAQGVRHAAGQQARLLNQMAEEFYRDRKVSPKRLVEFLGHTRFEVFVGLILGIAVALSLWFFFPSWSHATLQPI